MSNKERNGQRQSRDFRIRRRPRLGYYLIFTDTRETEKNYLDGLKQFLPVEIRDNIVIKVKKTSTDNLIQAAWTIGLLILNFVKLGSCLTEMKYPILTKLSRKLKKKVLARLGQIRVWRYGFLHISVKCQTVIIQ